MNILIVEDDVPLADGLARMLEREGYGVDVAAHGNAALEAAGQREFELIILDLGLSGMDGFDVLRELRARGRRAPVLVLTARDGVDDRVVCLDLGADDYVAKPFAMPELSARIRAIIRRSHARRGPKLEYGPLMLNLLPRRATLAGAPLELAAREWAVLEALLNRLDKVVSKEAIIHAVSGWQEELSINAVEVYVSRLRAKLAPAGIRIRTVRGFGYLLEGYKS